jgi:hypothetical protein
LGTHPLEALVQQWRDPQGYTTIMDCGEGTRRSKVQTIVNCVT